MYKKYFFSYRLLDTLKSITLSLIFNYFDFLGQVLHKRSNLEKRYIKIIFHIFTLIFTLHWDYITLH